MRERKAQEIKRCLKLQLSSWDKIMCQKYYKISAQLKNMKPNLRFKGDHNLTYTFENC